MFGYVVIHKPELKIKDYDCYQSYYCGLCEVLKHRLGPVARMTLNYDMTMMVLLLTSLYDTETEERDIRCIVHPMGKHHIAINEFTEYAADMNVLLAYEKAMDDVSDEGKLAGRVLGWLLRSKAIKIRERYPEKAKRISCSLKELSRMEQENEDNIDALSGTFGRLMATVINCREDIWSRDLEQFGFFLGKFIYILDAFDDLEKDCKTGAFNYFKNQKDDPDLEQKVEELLEMMMTDATQAMERLPLIDHVDILRNIVYAGVWTRFIRKKEERKKDDEQRSL